MDESITEVNFLTTSLCETRRGKYESK
jgi:hypothetical protein